MFVRVFNYIEKFFLAHHWCTGSRGARGLVVRLIGYVIDRNIKGVPQSGIEGGQAPPVLLVFDLVRKNLTKNSAWRSFRFVWFDAKVFFSADDDWPIFRLENVENRIFDANRTETNVIEEVFFFKNRQKRTKFFD